MTTKMTTKMSNNKKMTMPNDNKMTKKCENKIFTLPLSVAVSSF